MLNTLIGDIKNGRIVRLQFLGYTVMLSLILFAFVLLVIFIFGAGEHLLGGNLKTAQDQLSGWFALPFILILGVLVMLFIFILASINLMAKRIRDIGLPGWWSVLIFVILEAVVSSYISQQAGSGLHILTWLLLIFVPSNALAKK